MTSRTRPGSLHEPGLARPGTRLASTTPAYSSEVRRPSAAPVGAGRTQSDRGTQYTSIALGERLAKSGIRPSVGAVGSSFDNALAETINGLCKTELIKRRGPWRGVDHVEIATAE